MCLNSRFPNNVNILFILFPKNKIKFSCMYFDNFVMCTAMENSYKLFITVNMTEFSKYMP